MSDVVFVFPGQSSATPTMLDDAAALAPDVAEPLLAEASEVLGRDVRAWISPSNPTLFAANLDVQVGVFLANEAARRALEAAGVRSARSFGLSLGEYNHLVDIGALAFADALRLVHARGVAYDAGPRGIMAAVWPIAPDRLAALLAPFAARGAVAISNLNSPIQQVIAGDEATVRSALQSLEDDHDLSVQVIEERVPMHSPVLRPAADALRPALDAAPWRPARAPYLPNVDAEPLAAPTAADFVDRLYRHVYEPVRFQASAERVARECAAPVFVEVGPRGVVAGLLRGKWWPHKVHRTDSRSGLDEAIAAAKAG